MLNRMAFNLSAQLWRSEYHDTNTLDNIKDKIPHVINPLNTELNPICQ